MPSLRTVFKVVGFVLMAAALVFVGMQVAQYVQDLRAAATRPQTWFAVVAGAVLYAALSLLLSGAWQTILARAGAGAPVSLRTCYEVYGRSQIAKYVPGNVFHFVGRQLLGRSAGWAQGAIALSSVVETLLMGSAAAFIVLLLGALDRSVALKIAPPGILVIGALAAIGVPWLMMRYGRILPGLRNLGPLARADRLARSSALLIPLAIYVAFFAATACVFWLLAAWMFGGVEVSVLPGVAAAFVSGWLLGNITPSAPGGIGVREAVILPQLAHLIGGPQAVVVVVMFRLVTIGGDVLFFAVASWLAAGKTRNPDSREPVPR